MVQDHEDYYQGCVMQMIQRWRRRLGEGNIKGKGSTITLSLDADGQCGDMVHLDAIKYMAEVIAENLGRMYGLQIYYYRKPGLGSGWYGRVRAGISIAGPGHGPVLHHASVLSLGP